MKCNFCGSEDNEIIFEYTRFERNNILRCKNCGLVFLELKKTKKEVESFYKKAYREVNSLPKKSAEEMFNYPVIRHDFTNRIEWIKKRYGSIKGKRILEIGSSSEYFLDTLTSMGAKEVVGIELTEDYTNYAKKLGFTIYTKPIEDIGFKNEFDLVVSFHTLEHVSDSMSVLHAIMLSLIRGAFIGEIPNQNDWRIRIFDNYVVKRFHYDTFHYYYFSPKTLINYLKKCGFSKIILETVERCNRLIQLRRILCGEYNEKYVDRILKQNVFAKPEEDVRIPHLNSRQETEFNRIFGKGGNSKLMCNCLRWMATKR